MGGRIKEIATDLGMDETVLALACKVDDDGESWTLFQGRHNRLAREEGLGTITSENVRVEKNKLAESLLYLLGMKKKDGVYLLNNPITVICEYCGQTNAISLIGLNGLVNCGACNGRIWL